MASGTRKKKKEEKEKNESILQIPEEDEFYFRGKYVRDQIFEDVEDVDELTWFEDMVCNLQSGVSGIWFETDQLRKSDREKMRKFEDQFEWDVPNQTKLKAKWVKNAHRCTKCHQYKLEYDQLQFELNMLRNIPAKKIRQTEITKRMKELVDTKKRATTRHICKGEDDSSYRCPAFQTLNIQDCPTRGIDCHPAIKLAIATLKEAHQREKDLFNEQEENRVHGVEVGAMMQDSDGYYESQEFEQKAMKAFQLNPKVATPEMVKLVVSQYREKMEKKKKENEEGPAKFLKIQQNFKRQYDENESKKESTNKKQKTKKKPEKNRKITIVDSEEEKDEEVINSEEEKDEEGSIEFTSPRGYSTDLNKIMTPVKFPNMPSNSPTSDSSRLAALERKMDEHSNVLADIKNALEIFQKKKENLENHPPQPVIQEPHYVPPHQHQGRPPMHPNTRYYSDQPYFVRNRYSDYYSPY